VAGQVRGRAQDQVVAVGRRLAGGLAADRYAVDAGDREPVLIVDSQRQA
jgi:hypothetical protein